jgi:chromate reductase
MAVNMPTMQAPEAYIGGSDKLFDTNGEFVNPATRDLCAKFISSFEAWIRRSRSQS